jgi:hypothetical protein
MNPSSSPFSITPLLELHGSQNKNNAASRSLLRSVSIAALSVGLWCFSGLINGVCGQNVQNVRLLPMGAMRGTEVSIELPGKYEKWPVAFWGEPAQIQWAATEVPGKITAKIPMDAELGVHYLRIHSPESVSPLMRFVVGDIPEVTEVEPNDGFEKPQVLAALPLCINGVLQKSGDVDHYQVRLMAGEVLRATLDASRVLASPMDGCLELVDHRGNVLAQNLDTLGLDPRLVFQARVEGVYSLRVYAFPEAPDSTIGYAGGEKYQYRLRCAVGSAISVAADGTAADGTAADATAASAVEASLTVMDDLAAGFSQGAQWIGEPSGREMPSSLASAAGSSVAAYGVFETARDEDVLQWQTSEPGFWKVTAKALSLGSPVDPVLEILDAEGKSLAKQGESGEIADLSLSGQMKQPGVYRIAVRDLHGGFGPEHRYRLEIVQEYPVVRGTVGNDLFVGKPDKPVEIEVTLERTHGCDAEATVRLVGLPANYVCEPVVSKMKEESEKKVTVKVVEGQAGEQGVWSGPVGVEIQTTGRGIPEKVVATGTKQSWLWLRIAP